MKMKQSDLERLVDEFPKAKILVVGDAMIDHTVYGKMTQSPDLPQFRGRISVDRQLKQLGGAANAAANIRSLGGQAYLMCTTGEDESAKTLKDLCRAEGIMVTTIKDKDRMTTVKLRSYETNGQHPEYHHRLDFETAIPLKRDQVSYLSRFLEQLDTGFTGILVSDYAKGMITEDSMWIIKEVAKNKGIPVIVDPSRKSTIEEYCGVDLIKPNQVEAQVLLDHESYPAENMAEMIAKRWDAEVVYTTGKEGMYVFSKDKMTRIGACNLKGKVIDTVGAGDSVAAMLSIAKSVGIDTLQAAALANAAAALSIQQEVCGRPTTAQILKEYNSLYSTL